MSADRPRRGPPRRSRPAGRGSVLIYVVWVVLLLSLFAGGVGLHALSALSISERMAGQVRASFLVRGGLLLAAAALAEDATPIADGPTDPWANDPMRFRDRAVAGGTITVTAGWSAPGSERRSGLLDEERKVNLNTATVEILAALAQRQAGLKDDDARALAAAIVDWRDEDSDETDGGAENYYYQTRRPGYDCKDAPFEHVEELLLIRGMSAHSYQALLPYVTTYGSGQVNLNTADRVVLGALGFSDAGVGGFLAYRSGEDGAPGTPDDRQFQSVGDTGSVLEPFMPADQLAHLRRLVTDELVGITARAFAARIQASTGRATERMTASVVLDRDGRVLVWSER